MLIKRILILLPVVVLAILLQSYWWVPNYDNQTKGNPKRLTQYVTASIGDAALLNPILNADSASSEICDKIFEGLIDRDEELRLRGRLAEDWKIYEEAWFYVNRGPEWVQKGLATAGEVKKFIEQAMVSDRPESLSLQGIDRIEIIPDFTEERVVSEEIADAGGEVKEIKAKVTIHHPPRMKVVLHEINQDFFDTLETLLGKGYFHQESLKPFLEISDPRLAGRQAAYLEQYLPVVEHNPVIIFQLRKGVRFSDGHEFDADDVRFTYEAIMDHTNRSPRRSDFEPVKRFEVLDTYRIKVVYKRLFQPALTAWAIGILPEHLLNKECLAREASEKGLNSSDFTMRQSEFNRTRPIGTGPFTFSQWQSDQFIHLVRNEDYWEGPPHFQEFFYRIIPDMLTQELEFYAGTVDHYGARAHQVDRLKQDTRFQNFSGLSYSYSYIGYNLRRELFQDKRVRKALTMAINIPEIIQYVLYGEGEVTTGPFLKQTDYYNRQIEPLPYDPEGALELLRQAGWEKDEHGFLRKNGKPFEFTIITNNGNPYREAILMIAQNAWKRLGMRVSADRVEWSVFLEKYVDVGNFDAVVLGWTMGIDPDLYQIWHSSQTGNYQLNFVSYKNDRADDLIVRIRQEYDEPRQIELCHRLHEMIYDDQPYTFLYVAKWTALLDKKIAVLERNTDGSALIKQITPTKTGSYSFHFNKWIKFPTAPVFSSGPDSG
ncbi:MAG: ABC transporter substrate-binding protein [bacterium]